MRLKRFCSITLGFALILGVYNACFALSTKTSKQSAIKKGTSVHTKIEAKGLYSQECYDAFFGCMDQFCMPENSNGGSCACSDDSIGYEKEFAKIQDMLEEAERIKTVEVEKVKAGANADIIFTGKRKYDENGNVLEIGEAETKNKNSITFENWFGNPESDEDEEEEEDFGANLADKQGAKLYTIAKELCLKQIPDSCEKDIIFLQQLYSQQIISDCKGFENLLKEKKASAKAALASAESDVRAALKESLNEANEYDLGQCMVEFKKCMLTDDACGKDWENCVFIVASANMQNESEPDTENAKAEMADKYGISPSTLGLMESKRNICERVLDKCLSVRNLVWPSFLREAAPTIKLAEGKAESKFRQSCLGDISQCIQKACKDDIEGKGVATMDACLSRPEMARSFCKVEIDPCEKMEPLIWGYVADKLAAMRVDACTQEVKDCFTDENRCGKDFGNCIGMDYEYIHNICPIETLVVCKANNPNFSMDDLDSMLAGLYLNIDNAMIERCQELVDKKMTEICGSTTDCNRFAANDNLGTGSLRSQKNGDIYRIIGLISFGNIKIVDGSSNVTGNKKSKVKNTLSSGKIDITDYLEHIRGENYSVENAGEIISSIGGELNGIAEAINRTIDMIEQDPEIQFCVSGRDLSQITGEKGEKTAGRFPNLLNQAKLKIALSALRKAQDNYNTKLNAEIAEATKKASVDIAQYMCQMLPYNNGTTAGSVAAPQATMSLTGSYAISYDVGTGVNSDVLKSASGHSAKNTGGGTMNAAAGSMPGKNGESEHIKVDLGDSGSREMWSVFNRESRICHFCTSTITKNCKTSHSLLGIDLSKLKGKKKDDKSSLGKNLECTESAPVEKCEDIQM